MELRSRHGLQAVFLFAFASLVLGSLALGPTRTSPEERLLFGPVLFWMIVLFSASLGLPRHFVREEEMGTADLLRLSASARAVFLGKLAAATSELLVLELLLVPLLLVFLDLRLPGSPQLWILEILLGGFGIAAASTLLGAIASQTRSPSALFGALALPILMPLLMLLVALGGAVGGFQPERSHALLAQLLLYDALVTAAGFVLFPAVWKR